MSTMEHSYMITSVKLEKQGKKRYLLYAGGEEPILSVHEDIWIKYRLMKGLELTKEQVEEIQEADHKYAAYSLAIAYLGAKPRTKKQMYSYLLRKEFEEHHIQYAIDRLEEERIVDDELYAKQFVQSRVNSALKGRHFIMNELRQRGVSKEASMEAIAELDYESELQAASTLADKKWRSLKGEYADRRRKLQLFIMRRGFPSDIVREVMKMEQFQRAVEEKGEDDGLLLDN
ncbi:RecX family transcriptional regulator [Paenibacillus sp. IITD108]